MKNRYQEGSALQIVAIVLLILMLATSLGFIYNQNFVNDKSDANKTNNNSNNSSNNETSGDANDSSNFSEIAELTMNGSGTNVAIKYPNSWSKTSSENTLYEYKPSIISISSPDRTTTVAFELGGHIMGDECGNPEAHIERIFSNRLSITGYSDAVFNSYVIDNANGTFSYSIGAELAKSFDGANMSDLKVGDQTCGISRYFFNVNDTELAPQFTLKVSFSDVMSDKAATLDEISEKIKTDNYKTAEEIVRSLYIKE